MLFCSLGCCGVKCGNVIPFEGDDLIILDAHRVAVLCVCCWELKMCNTNLLGNFMEFYNYLCTVKLPDIVCLLLVMLKL